ncbi:MAG: hypothetical protein CMJ78_20985 [Planctomycetaceae bacterium]|nr:hypothetical protein [Planctomycetaceae bacterium]
MAEAEHGGNIVKQLHQLHIELAGYENQLERGPMRINATDNLITKRQAAVDAEREKLTDFKKTVDAKNLQLKSNEAKILELRGKLNAATSNREFDIIKSQIEADEMANSVLEDEILECLDKVDQGQVAVGDLEKEVDLAEAQKEKLAGEVAAEKPGLEENVARLQGEIKEATKPLPSEVMEHYIRVVKSFGPDAMSSVSSRICQSCYIEISPQMNVELNSGKFVICRQCARILYQDEE